VVIRSFANEEVKIFFEQGRAAVRFGWNNVARIVARKLDQWRVVFRWSDLGPEDVDVVDYH
jgi:hypothetical protein